MKKRITNVRAYRYCATELIPRDIETDNIINDDRISILNDDFRNYDSTLSELTDEMYDAVWAYGHSDSETWFDDFFRGCRNRERMRECVKNFYIDNCNYVGWDDEHLEEILNSYYDVDDYRICEIHGCVQRDWCKIAYRTSLVTENEIDVFESALFNTGTAYEIYDYVTEDDYICVVYVPCRTVDHLSYIAKELECPKEKIKIA